MSFKLNFDHHQLKYQNIIGTGGIGTGNFFQLNGNATLGREESRSGKFLPIKDYCKQHIILHYIKVLLGESFSVVPIGKVGDDENGKKLLKEMNDTGFYLDHVETMSNTSTLFSFCFSYPDGSGGNLTTDNSASAYVDGQYMVDAVKAIKLISHRSIIMAAPEVPMSARQKLLELGKAQNAYCTASFTSQEISEAITKGIIKDVDLLSINLDEAAALSNIPTNADANLIVSGAIEKATYVNKKISIAITGGSQGSWCWNGRKLNKCPIIKTSVNSTAGAGDAFFSGLIIGTALGYPLFQSQLLATLIAGLSVSSPHTINHDINRQSLLAHYTLSGLTFSPDILKLFTV